MKRSETKSLSIFHKWLIAFLAVVITISGTLTAVFYVFSKKSIEKQTQERLHQVFSEAEHYINNEIEAFVKDIQLLASNPLLDEYLISSEIELDINARVLERLFLRSLKLMNDARNISFVDYSGKERVKVDRTGRIRRYGDVSGSRIFSEISSGHPGSIHLEGPHNHKEEKVLITVGIHKIDADIGEFGGAIIVDYSLENFLKHLNEIIIYDENPVWVFAPKGDVLRKPFNHKEMFDPRPFISEQLQDAPVLSELDEGMLIYQDFSLAPGKPLMRLAISIPTSLLFQDINKALRFFSIAFLFSLIITFLIVYYLSGYMSRPIVKLAAAAARLADGDFSHKATISSNDEIGLLAQSFNNMVDNLDQSQKSLKKSHGEMKSKMMELRSAKIEADFANRSKTQFLSNMSHELRTPMNAIMGFTEVLLDRHFGEINETQEEYLTDVHQSSKHLLSLINDILDLSKVEAGKMKLDLSYININSLLQGSLVMVKEKSIRHAIKLSADIEETPDVLVADERKIKQVVYNLLSNSIKFTPDGGSIHIDTKIVDKDWLERHLPARFRDNLPEAFGREHEYYLRISVADTGVGIKSESLTEIFDPFKQEDNSEVRKSSGTGLGLSLSQKIVELHKGAIWVESQEGQGSTFSFALPIVEEVCAVIEDSG